jgi:hypothetical protein
MSIQTAEVERPAPIQPESRPQTFDGTFLEPDQSMGVVRGIAKAILIAIPFWGLVGLAVYLLR